MDIDEFYGTVSDGYAAARENTMTKVEPIRDAIDQLTAAIDALKRRAYDAENVAWTLILNLEKSDMSMTSLTAIREYAVNEARPFLLRSPNPSLSAAIRKGGDHD